MFKLINATAVLVAVAVTITIAFADVSGEIYILNNRYNLESTIEYNNTALGCSTVERKVEVK